MRLSRALRGGRGRHERVVSRQAWVPGAHQIHGIFKAGFHLADLDLAYKRAKEREITIAYDLTPAKDVNLRTFTIRDPEGNLIQFFGV